VFALYVIEDKGKDRKRTIEGGRSQRGAGKKELLTLHNESTSELAQRACLLSAVLDDGELSWVTPHGRYENVRKRSQTP
jgi:hypothetical protein